jgi:hypothetical protein
MKPLALILRRSLLPYPYPLLPLNQTILPRVLGVEFVAAARHYANVGLGRQSPATSHWRAADKNSTPCSHHLSFLHHCLPFVLLRASALVLLGFMLWSVYRDRCLRPGCHMWWTAVSWAEASASRLTTMSRNLVALPWTWPHQQYMPHSALQHTLPHHHSISIASWPFHLFWAVAAYLGMVMPFLISLPHSAIIVLCTSALIIRELNLASLISRNLSRETHYSTMN